MAGGLCKASEKLVTTSPSMTELVFQLGYGNTIVATSQMSDFPDEAKTLPRIGTLFQPSLEKILGFAPNWVLIDGESSPSDFESDLKNLNINSLRVSIRSIKDLFDESKRILKTIFKQQSFEFVDNQLNHLLKEIGSTPSDFSFLIFAWSSPPILVGHNTFLSDLLSQFGGRNLLGDKIKATYPQVADEWIIKHPPQFVFVIADSEQQLNEIRTSSNRWWPKDKPKLIFLPSSDFARTSFTALKNLNRIRSQIP
ncbi:hypothetical protein EBQ74_12615 [bacterium]|nr:hypothetical protein [bacterium]